MALSPAPAAVPVLVPLARLHAAPWNPRIITEPRFQQLCRSLETDPDFLWQRPILAQLDGTIFGGNMRYRAAAHLGWPAVPALVLDVPDRLAKERAMRDNNQWGESVDQELAELLVGLQVDGADLRLLGFPEDDLRRVLDSVGALGDTGPGLAYGADDRGKTPDEKLELWETAGIRQIVLHFPLAEYQAVMARLDTLRAVRGLDTNAAVIADLLVAACPEGLDAAPGA